MAGRVAECCRCLPPAGCGKPMQTSWGRLRPLFWFQYVQSPLRGWNSVLYVSSCSDALDRLDYFFRPIQSSDFVLRHPGIRVKQTPHLKDSERTWKSLKVCIYSRAQDSHVNSAALVTGFGRCFQGSHICRSEQA